MLYNRNNIDEFILRHLCLEFMDVIYTPTPYLFILVIFISHYLSVYTAYTKWMCVCVSVYGKTGCGVRKIRVTTRIDISIKLVEGIAIQSD